MNGVIARVFKRISILMTSLKQGFLNDLKTHIGGVSDGQFF